MAAAVLRAAAAGGERGIHVMLVGFPGTGKTELAKTLAAQAGLSLYAAGEDENDAGKEPSRSERSASLRLTMALLGNRRDSAVLLDEAEDVLDSTRSFGEKRDAFSKAFLHRMIESSPVPVIWTCNHIDWMEPATLRRMALVLRVGVPNEAGRERIWRRVLDGEGLSLGEDAATRLAARWEASAGIAAGAARAARLAGGAENALQTALSGVARAVGVARSARKRIVEFDPRADCLHRRPDIDCRPPGPTWGAMWLVIVSFGSIWHRQDRLRPLFGWSAWYDGVAEACFQPALDVDGRD
jgi:SpoVK/Ycf46/Vps4 family AAA+-type ATPase